MFRPVPLISVVNLQKKSKIRFSSETLMRGDLIIYLKETYGNNKKKGIALTKFIK